MSSDGGAEIARFSLKVYYLGVGQDLDVGMPTGIQHTRPQYSYGAIHGGEGFIELSHPSPYGGRFLHQIGLYSGGGEIQRGLNAGDASAYYRHAFTLFPPGEQAVVLVFRSFFRYLE